MGNVVSLRGLSARSCLGEGLELVSAVIGLDLFFFGPGLLRSPSRPVVGVALAFLQYV